MLISRSYRHPSARAEWVGVLCGKSSRVSTKACRHSAAGVVVVVVLMVMTKVAPSDGPRRCSHPRRGPSTLITRRCQAARLRPAACHVVWCSVHRRTLRVMCAMASPIGNGRRAANLPSACCLSARGGLALGGARRKGGPSLGGGALMMGRN